MEFKVEFTESKNKYKKSNFIWESEWFDSSFSGDKKAIGQLRLPGVNNGRYKSKHPIVHKDENIGYLLNAATTLGYTYYCIYINRAECFYIAHAPFSAVWGNGHKASYISVVSRTGKFLIKRDCFKFERTKMFEFPETWVGTGTLAFKLNYEQTLLFFLSEYGFCLIDTFRQRLISKTNFDELSYSVEGFALSHKANLLAVAFSKDDYKDPLDGEYKYRNFINIYDLESGLQIGQKNLDTNEFIDWKIAFSKDGRQLVFISQTDQSEEVFDLVVKH